MYEKQTLGARVLLEAISEVSNKILSITVNLNKASHILRLQLNC